MSQSNKSFPIFFQLWYFYTSKKLKTLVLTKRAKLWFSISINQEKSNNLVSFKFGNLLIWERESYSKVNNMISQIEEYNEIPE